jgi:hypothetical protein
MIGAVVLHVTCWVPTSYMAHQGQCLAALPVAARVQDGPAEELKNTGGEVGYMLMYHKNLVYPAGDLCLCCKISKCSCFLYVEDLNSNVQLQYWYRMIRICIQILFSSPLETKPKKESKIVTRGSGQIVGNDRWAK